jgi:hypothetical protein
MPLEKETENLFLRLSMTISHYSAIDFLLSIDGSCYSKADPKHLWSHRIFCPSHLFITGARSYENYNEFLN